MGLRAGEGGVVATQPVTGEVRAPSVAGAWQQTSPPQEKSWQPIGAPKPNPMGAPMSQQLLLKVGQQGGLNALYGGRQQPAQQWCLWSQCSQAHPYALW